MTKKQVIFILGESVRVDMLNCYRQTGLRTPNLDSLAAEGMRFERAYNCQPVCTAARSAIWTGLYPHTNCAWANNMPLGNTTHTLGQFLHDKGVDTALIGKWHLDGVDYFGTGRSPGGWDPSYWYDMRDYLAELSARDRVRSRDEATGEDPTWTADMCFGKRCTDRAMQFLDEHRDQEFLLCLCYDEPHGPSLCPKEYSDSYDDLIFPSSVNVEDALINKPEEQRIWAGRSLRGDQPPIRAKQFFGCHTFVDAQIGRLLDRIQKTVPNALVIYTSDHGVFLESHRLTGKGPATYEEITHVPFIVRWAGHTPSRTVNQSLMSHIDIAPTLMQFWGFEVPATLEGQSVLAAFTNPVAPTRDAVFIEWGRFSVDHDAFGGYQPIRCICDGRYKLSVNLMTDDELYDLESDSAEMNNLINSATHASIRNQLHDRLLNQMNVSRDPFRGYYWGRRPWRPEFPESWENSGMIRQRKCDGYLPVELDFGTGLPLKAFTYPETNS